MIEIKQESNQDKEIKKESQNDSSSCGSGIGDAHGDSSGTPGATIGYGGSGGGCGSSCGSEGAHPSVKGGSVESPTEAELKDSKTDSAHMVSRESAKEMKWNYMGLKHYVNHLHFFRRQPLLLWRMMMGVLKTRVLKKRMVRSVELAVTYNCNLRCDKCFALKWLEEKKSKFLTVDEIKKLWDQAYAMGATHVNLTGGEPIGRKDIADVVRALKPRGTLISLVTNGIMVTEEKIIALRKAGLNTLQVSLDSSKPELHDRYRGYKGCYDKAINAARLALKHGLNVCFTTIATHENIKTDDLPEMLKIARKMGILLLINFAGRSGGWHEKDFLTLTKEDKKVLDKYMKDPYARLSQMFNYYLKPGMCLMGKDKFNVSAYGEVYPCTHVFLKFGNIRDEPLKDILYRMNHFKHFKDITYDCPRCDHQDFIEEYMDPIARDERPMLDVDKDFGYVHTEGVKVS